MVVVDPCAPDVSLERHLRSRNCYETDSGLEHRDMVMKSLNHLVQRWIQNVSLDRGIPWEMLDHVGGRVMPYGSHMLGISHKGADIDALCVAPNHISREEWFTSFPALLSAQSEVQELRAIEEAYVPVLKMKFGGIEIDMTFVTLNKDENPTDVDLMDKVELSLLELRCIRSLNGYRSTQMILKLVPDLPVFQLVLRAVKLWAKTQGLYSNILGYLGGFSWAVMVAKTCIDYPGETPSRTLYNFFVMFSDWQWPEPVRFSLCNTKNVIGEKL